MAVNGELGHGFLENVYQEALAREFEYRRYFDFDKSQLLTHHYRGQSLSATYKADFVCYGSLLVELKALQRLTSNEEAQVINYLGLKLKKALILNFGTPSLEYKRLVLNLR